MMDYIFYIITVLYNYLETSPLFNFPDFPPIQLPFGLGTIEPPPHLHYQFHLNAFDFWMCFHDIKLLLVYLPMLPGGAIQYILTGGEDYNLWKEATDSWNEMVTKTPEACGLK